MKNFGERLKKIRNDSHTTQDTLAEYLGVSYQAVSKWENSIAFPDITLVPAIANFFGVTADYLLGVSLDNTNEKIETILKQARSYTHTGEINKSIEIIEEALKTYPNEHKLLSDLIEYKVMVYEDTDEWLANIEQKANLIFRDCNIDKIRYKTIVDLAFAYSFCGKREKVKETADLLPDVAYSKMDLLSLAVPAKERADYKADCILASAEKILCDILCISKHNYIWGDPNIAIDVCHRALAIIKALGEEGYLLYMKASAYEDLMFAYAKLNQVNEMFNAMEEVVNIFETIESVLSNGGQKYNSSLLSKLTFDKNTMSFNVPISDFERYYNIISNAKSLKPFENESRFKKVLNRLQEKMK